MSKSNIQKVSNNNLSPNYLHDDRHLKRNRSAAKTISGVELLCSNNYCALLEKQPEPGTLTKSLPYTRRNNRNLVSWNLVSHISEGTNIRHIVMRNLIQQDQLHQIHQGDWKITCNHNTMLITKITCTLQQTGGIPHIHLAKW